jgi:hypothetical protein
LNLPESVSADPFESSWVDAISESETFQPAAVAIEVDHLATTAISEIVTNLVHISSCVNAWCTEEIAWEDKDASRKRNMGIMVPLLCHHQGLIQDLGISKILCK